VVGTFTKQALKASSGEKVWLDFFKYASVEFSRLENCPIDENYAGVDTFKKLQECDNILGINNRLSAFKVAVKTISAKKSKGLEAPHYFLLRLDLSKRMMNLQGFTKSQLEKATQIYNEEEQKYSKDNSKDIVLVSAGSLRDLKKAYPNYFSDTEYFSRNIDTVYLANQDGL